MKQKAVVLLPTLVAHLHLVGLAGGLLSPVTGPGGGSGVGQRLDAPLGGPVVLESGASGKMTLDLLQRHHRADLVREQLVSDALDLAMKSE